MLTIGSKNTEKVHIRLNPTKPDPADPTKRVAGGINGPVRVTVVSGESTVAVDANGLGFVCTSGATPDSTTIYDVEADAVEDGSLISDGVTYNVATLPPPPVTVTNDLGLVADAPEPK